MTLPDQLIAQNAAVGPVHAVLGVTNTCDAGAATAGGSRTANLSESLDGSHLNFSPSGAKHQFPCLPQSLSHGLLH